MKTYQLKINIEKKIHITVGKLGKFVFSKGIYIYTGSAKKNINHRLKRHLTRNKKLHWHIDYLLSNNLVQILAFRKFNIEECVLNKFNIGTYPVKGFGSSDCKKKCISHLKQIL